MGSGTNRKGTNVQSAVNKSPKVLTWVVGISVITFCMAGTAAVMGWIPTSLGSSADDPNPATTVPVTKKPIASKVRDTPAPGARNAVPNPTCSECGVIESTREIDSPGGGGLYGIVGGAVVGGILGNQVGSGRGKDLATVAGAAGGAVAGNEVEKRVRSSKSYETTVRFDDGSTRVFSETSQAQWRSGDRVKVVDGVIRRNG